MHSPESGGPEMLMELAYRLVVEETPFIQNIRNNVITLITPVIEVDGREKYVDNHYFNEKWAKDHAAGAETRAVAAAVRCRSCTGASTSQHDNNRDGMGQFLDLTKNTTKTFLEWTPTVLHDLHEAQTYLYASTGTGPYNDALDPIIVDEWWMLAKNDVMEMTKRGVPGVWTYGFYDGWVPNYMFFIAHTHNAIGRFYEVQSYCRRSNYVGAARRDDDEQGVVPPEPAARLDHVEPARQHEHPGVGDSLRAQPRREGQGDVPRELLAQEQARRRQGQERPGLRVGHSGEPARACRTRPKR